MHTRSILIRIIPPMLINLVSAPDFLKIQPSIVRTSSLRDENMQTSLHFPLTKVTLLQNTDRVVQWDSCLYLVTGH